MHWLVVISLPNIIIGSHGHSVHYLQLLSAASIRSFCLLMWHRAISLEAWHLCVNVTLYNELEDGLSIGIANQKVIYILS